MTICTLLNADTHRWELNRKVSTAGCGSTPARCVLGAAGLTSERRQELLLWEWSRLKSRACALTQPWGVSCCVDPGSELGVFPNEAHRMLSLWLTSLSLLSNCLSANQMPQCPGSCHSPSSGAHGRTRDVDLTNRHVLPSLAIVTGPTDPPVGHSEPMRLNLWILDGNIEKGILVLNGYNTGRSITEGCHSSSWLWRGEHDPRVRTKLRWRQSFGGIPWLLNLESVLAYGLLTLRIVNVI